MADDPPVAIDQAAKLQEAIDTIVQSFGHPASLQIHYTATAGEKRTTFDLESSSRTVELTYDGRDDDAEPRLTRRD